MGEKPCQCDICGIGFKNSNALRQHKDQVHFKTKITCPICGGIFVSKRNLKRHIESVRNNEYLPIILYISWVFFQFILLFPPQVHRGKKRKYWKTKGIDDRLTVQNTDELNKYYPKYKTVSKMRIMWQNLPS